jgi:glycosyltransferase involved in cell wall biosynthesis
MPAAMSHLPLVSFIMPVYNRANVIERALDGILRERAENYPNLEIVVIDGGSKDGTVEILKRYGDKIDYWVSEKDSGAAEAFNKGVKAAKGEIIRYVASDDGIVNGFTRLMVEHLDAHPEVAVAGALAENFNVGPDGIPQPDDSKPTYTPGRLTFEQALYWTRGERFSLIESWFMRRSTFDQVGLLDTSYRICPDYDFALRLVKAGLVFEVLPHRIVHKYFYTDGSNLVADTPRRLKENRNVCWRHAGGSWLWIKWRYCHPDPLHKRFLDSVKGGFFRLWLSFVKKWKFTSPKTYALLQRQFKN